MKDTRLSSLFKYVFPPLFGLLLASSALSQALIADHASTAQFDQIPIVVVENIADTFRFCYGHTSHGSQVITGLDMVAAENSIYTPPNFYEFSDDLGTLGDTTWVAQMRWRLDNYDYNMAMMSWCGGVSTNNEAGINIYLDKMNELEQDYPDVTFIYMTGHLDGSGPEGNLYAMNNLIRNYCLAYDKILFDFADIESYDPDGTYYPDETDACEWCTAWCGAHACPDCAGCAHSHCFNCYQKGKAFWWLMARIDGWVPGGGGGCGDITKDGAINVLDIIYLVDYKFKGGPAPDPMTDADVNSDGLVNILDIIYLIDFKYEQGPAPDCP